MGRGGQKTKGLLTSHLVKCPAKNGPTLISYFFDSPVQFLDSELISCNRFFFVSGVRFKLWYRAGDSRRVREAWRHCRDPGAESSADRGDG